MFDESSLVVIPPLHEDQHGKFSRPAAACTLEDVRTKLTSIVDHDVKFEVEPTDVGYRILMASFSSHSRRRSAAKIIQAAKKDLKDSFGLLQYNKPHDLRMLQRDVHKFLAVVQKRSGGAVTDKQLKNGYLVINGIRFAPEYLVPRQGRWNELADEVIKKIKSWRGRAPVSPDQGLMTDYFGYVFAADKGVFDLSLAEEDAMDMGGFGGSLFTH
jgi:hypothetical protein